MASQAMGQGEIAMRRSLDNLGMVLVRQRWRQPEVSDPEGAVREELARSGALQRVKAGDEVAITAGSRGIALLPQVLKAVVAVVRERGGLPFIFPAMGSHGGGTAEGQREMLAGMGIDEQAMGAPLRCTMEVVQLGTVGGDLPVYLDAHAARAAGIILVNRVKKHTNFDGPVESGLCKMATIGMGKHAGAVAMHQLGNARMSAHIQQAAELVFRRTPVVAGLALLENARGGLAAVRGLRPGEILAEEPALLQRAKNLSAKIPFRETDVAIVEQMGKDVSGTGMDCYVIGRKRIIGEPEWPEAPRISSLVVLDLTPASHGNAVGVGLADFTTRRLVDKIDWAVVQANVLTSGNMERAKLPLAYDTARQAIEAAAFRERAHPLGELRLVCLRDTLHLRYLYVSAALAREALARDEQDLEVVGGPNVLSFDEQGQWRTPFPGEWT